MELGKFRHIGALALVVWYLMLPPLVLRDSVVDLELPPLSKWSTLGRYDSAAECWHDRAWRQVFSESSLAEFQPHLDFLQPQSPSKEATFDMGIAAAQCIASDDPRLKESK